MREGSSIDHFFGRGVPEEQIEKHRRDFQDRFADQEFSDLEKIERQPSEHETYILRQIDTYLNARRSEYDLPEFHLPQRNLHIIPAEHWMYPPEDQGVHTVSAQTIVMKEQPSPTMFAAIAFHEIVHAHSYQSVEVRNEAQETYYRVGYSLQTEPKGSSFLNWLNEAATQKLTMKFIKDTKEDPVFAEDRVRINRLFEITKGLPEYEDLLKNIVDVRRTPQPNGDAELRGEFSAYRVAREAVEVLQADLEQKFPEQFEPGIFDQLLEKGIFTGNLLWLGKAVDRAYGVGSFRALAETKTSEDFFAAIERLVRQQ